MRVPAILFALLASAAQVAPPDALVRARQAYNDHKYEEAIAAAIEARKLPGLADAATLISARAYLERYRDAPASSGDLIEARRLLKEIDPAKLSAREHVEFLVGVGEALYLENSLSAAAEFFSLALARAGTIDPDARELVFEW